MKRLFTLTAAAFSTWMLASVFAATADAADDATPPAAADRAATDNAALFDRLDANHDGQITADEVPQESRRLFDRLLRRADKNGDGKLSREEFMAGMADDRPKRVADGPDRPAAVGKPQVAGDGSEDSSRIEVYPIRVADPKMVLKVLQTTLAGESDIRMDIDETSKSIVASARPSQQAKIRAIVNNLESDGKPQVVDGMRAGGGRGGFGGGGAMAGGGPGPFMGIAIFKALDTNNDGKLDAKEIAAAGEVLKKLANSGGEITREELLKSLPAGMGPGGGAPGAAPNTAAGPGPRAGRGPAARAGGLGGGGRGIGGGLRGILQTAVSSGSGAADLPSHLMKALDKNGDGKLQKDELPPALANRFDELDTNHDGALDESELKVAVPDLLRRFQNQQARGMPDGGAGQPSANRPAANEMPSNDAPAAEKKADTK